MARLILLAHFRNFHVTAERQQDDNLQTKPVVVVRGRVVVDASAEASACGVKLGTSASRILRLCPEAQVIEFVRERYLSLYQTLWDILAEHTPLVEPTELHEGFFDLTGCLPREERLDKRVEVIRQTIWKAAGIHCALGGGASKLVAKLAMPRDRYVSPETTSEFLEDLSVTELDCIDTRTRERLIRLGIDTIGRLARVPENALARHFGQTGALLHRLSQGIDPSPVLPLYPPRREEVTQHFAPAEDNEAVLQSHLLVLSDHLWDRLTKSNEEASQVELQIAVSHQPSAISHQPTAGTIHHSPITPSPHYRITQLPCPVSTSSRLLALFQSQFHEAWNHTPVSSLTLAVSDLRPKGSAQLNLWDNMALKLLAGQLDEALRALRQRYGVLSVQTGRQYHQRRRPRLAEQILQRQEEWLMKKAA